MTGQKDENKLGMNLPDEYRLAYYLPLEAWYADTIRRWDGDNRYVVVSAAHKGGGCAWEFKITEKDLGGPTTCLQMFSDSYDAFQHIPGFFDALRMEAPKTVAEVITILLKMGAEDRTPRNP